jgi:hypothetical protein
MGMVWRRLSIVLIGKLMDVYLSKHNRIMFRVMTVSFHKFGEYFPGTGDVKDKVH